MTTQTSTTLQRVRETIAAVLVCDLDEVTPSTRLRTDLRTDSLDEVQIIIAIEDEFSIEIDDEDAMATFGDDCTVQFVSGLVERLLAGAR